MLGLIGLYAVLALAAAAFVVPIEYSERNSAYQYGNISNLFKLTL